MRVHEPAKKKHESERERERERERESVCTYRPAADRRRSDGSRTGGRAEVIQRTREESCTKDRSGEKKTLQSVDLKTTTHREQKKQKKQCLSFTVKPSSSAAGNLRSKPELSCSCAKRERDGAHSAALPHSLQTKSLSTLLLFLLLLSLSPSLSGSPVRQRQLQWVGLAGPLAELKPDSVCVSLRTTAY